MRVVGVCAQILKLRDEADNSMSKYAQTERYDMARQEEKRIIAYDVSALQLNKALRESCGPWPNTSDQIHAECTLLRRGPLTHSHRPCAQWAPVHSVAPRGRCLAVWQRVRLVRLRPARLTTQP